jgi:hypothetical protein
MTYVLGTGVPGCGGGETAHCLRLPNATALRFDAIRD